MTITNLFTLIVPNLRKPETEVVQNWQFISTVVANHVQGWGTRGSYHISVSSHFQVWEAGGDPDIRSLPPGPGSQQHLTKH